LLLDEDSQAKYLVDLLYGVGRDVVTVNEIGLGGLPDSSIAKAIAYISNL
jgi:hypothetical protein